MVNQTTLRLGVIGLSEGNGHPYSWAAICNGFSPEHMNACEFPVIPQYLAKQNWPDARIPDVEVTHIWTQDTELSQRVANASLIPHVVANSNSMLGKIDALLLARDDAENHLKFAEPFIKAGIPIYIDKPVALTLREMEKLYQLEQYQGQIFTCSALRFANELMLSEKDQARIGPIRHLQANTPNSWEKYAVHVIEPSLKIVGAQVDLFSTLSRNFSCNGRAVSVRFDNGITADFAAYGNNVTVPLSIRVFGEQGWLELFFVDTFNAFKTALSEFIGGVRSGTCRSPLEFNRQVVSIIEAGLYK